MAPVGPESDAQAPSLILRYGSILRMSHAPRVSDTLDRLRTKPTNPTKRSIAALGSGTAATAVADVLTGYAQLAQFVGWLLNAVQGRIFCVPLWARRICYQRRGYLPDDNS